ncbi:polysaccharide deacetylase family protein [Chitinimonas sp. BJYL2]|uniref:polysaccharide deacetylase family protein n=1 Tax=Chitinimonas sp. BJYL2 TaxID=2976696 RepID=UPI0022B40539|nr:polysaccharide deacetylase family protein [Chitinimonas sp. BJYL2]
MRQSLLLLLALLTLPVWAGKQIALTFDDGFDPRKQPQAAEWNAQILATLDKAGIKSLLLPSGKNVDSPAGLTLVRAWGEAGHQIGNHTYTHRDYSGLKYSLADFDEDMTRNAALFKDMPGWTQRFRFPYLKEGATSGRRDGLRLWLREHGYKTAPVSVDASDWYYDERFLAWQARHPDADPAPFRQAYLDHIRNRADYYHQLGQKVVGREFPHVLLLHTNAINAAFLGDLIAMLRKEGWSFVSAETAFADPLYMIEPDFVPAGESLLWMLGKVRRLPDMRYPAEDSRYEARLLDAAGL